MPKTELFVAFTPDSYWNKLAKAVATDPGPTPTGYGGTRNQNYVKLIKTSDWAYPIYWTTPTDPEYTIGTYTLRIPLGATPMAGSDGAMILLDTERMESYSLWQAVYHQTSDTWTAASVTFYDMASDGLCTTPPNEGHRGIPPTVMAIRKDELLAGVIPHRLEVYWPGTKSSHVYPMCGHESGRCNAGQTCPPEGAVIAIDPAKDLTTYGLSPYGLVIARCLQDYGATIGDNSPKSGPCIKMERAAKDMVAATELSKVPMKDYVTKSLGWR